MSYQPHYIASFENDSGLFTYYEPFLIPEKAFADLEDAYCWRGRVIKRPGYELLGRLRRTFTARAIGNISAPGAGVVNVNLFTALGLTAIETNAQIQPGTATVPLVIAIGAPISQTLTDNTGTGTLSIAPAGVITAATINYATGILSLTFSGAAGASAATFTGAYFPGLPVMGLRTLEVPAINAEQMIAFDQVYAYQFNSLTGQFQEFIPTGGAVTWNGADNNFFWSTNYYQDSNGKLFWVTNTNMTGATKDPIRYYDTNRWTTFAPLITATDTLFQAEVIVAYKDRLLFLNTWEGTTAGGINAATNFPQRVRWSQNGVPFVDVPTGGEVDAYRDDIVGKGGFLDAPTSEVLISAEFIKDTLLVKFERSSWKLVYTGNEVLPFVFQKINTELGSESKFSLVPFDRAVFSVSNYGITSDDSVNVERIDLQIPNTVFQFNNDKSGVVRVHGIRDYANELVYWTYSDAPEEDVEASAVPSYPDKVLIYNYRNNTYANTNDSFMCFGYFQRQQLTWAEIVWKWNAWKDPWNSGVVQDLFPNVVAGNQEGFVEIIAQQVQNDPSLFITSMNPATNQFLVLNHNLEDGNIIKVDNCVGTNASLMNGFTYKVGVIDDDNIVLYQFNPTTLLFDVDEFVPAADYIGNGVITKIQNYIIKSKVFTPFYETGHQCRLGYIDFLLDRTDEGETLGDVFIDENNSVSMTDPNLNPSLLGTNVINTAPDNTTLLPFQAIQDKIWHRQFVQTIAQNFQFQLTMSDVQNAQESIANSDLQLHAIAFYLSPNARMTQ